LKNGSDLLIIESTPLRYILSLPAGRDPKAEAAPLMCFLHGYDEAAPLDILQALTRHGPLRAASWLGAVARYIIVAPQLPRGGDIWHRYADPVREIVTEVQGAHNGDVQRAYLTGFSYGGNGVFDLALIQPNLWAALWPVDPTRIPHKDPQRPIWLSFGEVSRYQKSGFIRALDLKPAIENAEGDRFYLDQGQDHAGSAALAYKDERIYAWLLSKRLH
jgi:predicted peptidase